LHTIPVTDAVYRNVTASFSA